MPFPLGLNIINKKKYSKPFIKTISIFDKELKKQKNTIKYIPKYKKNKSKKK